MRTDVAETPAENPTLKQIAPQVDECYQPAAQWGASQMKGWFSDPDENRKGLPPVTSAADEAHELAVAIGKLVIEKFDGCMAGHGLAPKANGAATKGAGKTP
jgi:hypothetical protein